MCLDKLGSACIGGHLLRSSSQGFDISVFTETSPHKESHYDSCRGKMYADGVPIAIHSMREIS